MTELVSAASISTARGLTATSLFPVTTSVGSTLYKVTGAEIAAAFGPAGNLSMTSRAAAARLAARTTSYTSGSKVDALITAGDLRGLLLDAYCSGSQGSSNPVVATSATITVPAGKEAFLIYYSTNKSVITDTTYYKHWITNTTTSTDYNSVSGGQHYSGAIGPDGANNTVVYPLRIGVAGDVLVMKCSSAGDGNSRAVSGFAVIALRDTTTGAVDMAGGI